MWEILNRGGHPYDNVVGLDNWEMAKLFIQNVTNTPVMPDVLLARMNIELFNDLSNIIAISWSQDRQDRQSFLFYSDQLASIFNFVGRCEVSDLNLDLFRGASQYVEYDISEVKSELKLSIWCKHV